MHDFRGYYFGLSMEIRDRHRYVLLHIYFLERRSVFGLRISHDQFYTLHIYLPFRLSQQGSDGAPIFSYCGESNAFLGFQRPAPSQGRTERTGSRHPGARAGCAMRPDWGSETPGRWFRQAPRTVRQPLRSCLEKGSRLDAAPARRARPPAPRLRFPPGCRSRRFSRNSPPAENGTKSPSRSQVRLRCWRLEVPEEFGGGHRAPFESPASTPATQCRLPARSASQRFAAAS